MTEPLKLPVRPLPTADVDIDGTTITVRGLSRAAALKVTTAFGAARADEAEDFIVAQGTGITEAEAHAWREATEATAAGAVVDKILELSALLDLEDKNAPDPKP
jgi:phosphoglycolate phosphatase-like HAD superfamily hydrolase